MRYPVLNLGASSWQMLQPYGGWGYNPAPPPPPPPPPPAPAPVGPTPGGSLSDADKARLQGYCTNIINVWSTARSGTSDQMDAEKLMQTMIGTFPPDQQTDVLNYMQWWCANPDFWRTFVTDFPYPAYYTPSAPEPELPSPPPPPYNQPGQPWVPSVDPYGRWKQPPAVPPPIATLPAGGTTAPAAASTGGETTTSGGEKPPASSGAPWVATQGASSNKCPPGQFDPGNGICRGSLAPGAAGAAGGAGGGSSGGGSSPSGITMGRFPLVRGLGTRAFGGLRG